MKRDPRAFLSDVIEAGHTIQMAVDGISLDDYRKSRLIRPSVEREFAIIGEALSPLSRRDADLFSQIHQAPQIISFRSKLTHEYVGLAELKSPGLRADLPKLLSQPLLVHMSNRPLPQDIHSFSRIGEPFLGPG